MKNKKIILIIIMLLLIFTGCNKEDNTEYLIEINYEEFKQKRENKDTFFFEVIQDGCSACMAYSPILKEILTEYKIVGYQLNINDMTEEEYDEFQLEFKITGTPTTIFLTEGEEISKMQRISGSTTKTKTISKLTANGYIKDTEN